MKGLRPFLFSPGTIYYLYIKQNDMTALPRPKADERLLTNNSQLPAGRQMKVGDIHREDHGHSQFAGAWNFKVTRVEPNGDVYVKYHSGDVYEMDIEDCM